MKRALRTLISIAITAFAVVTFSQVMHPSGLILHGSLFVSDAGRSHGGFEYNAEWNATLTVQGSSGVLTLALQIGLGDALQKHEFQVTEFVKEPSRIRMLLDGQPTVLIWQESETIWDHAYDRYYVASWGGDAPPEEIRGTISPTVFPGLPAGYYVELRLR